MRNRGHEADNEEYGEEVSVASSCELRTIHGCLQVMTYTLTRDTCDNGEKSKKTVRMTGCKMKSGPCVLR